MSQDKINFIKTIFPNVEKILPFATQENLEKLFEQAQEKLSDELTEAQFE